MTDHDLAKIFRVKLEVLLRAVKRNRRRFPKEFIFRITRAQNDQLRSTSLHADESPRSSDRIEYVFTQEGVAMLSSILTSQSAVELNIRIMRDFARKLRPQYKNFGFALPQPEEVTSSRQGVH